jgi:tRNA(Leu) C34 or U34 (ribose-2'-O)-methylase TrmL
MTSDIKSAIWGKNSPQHGETPSILLVNPKYPDNVGKVVRLASCYGFKQVWWTGNRVKLDPSGKQRLPREERMRGYGDVSMIQCDRPFEQFPQGVTPVAIEVRDSSMSLLDFDHPPNPLYVFGPEDGSIDKVLLGHCHQFVIIPTRHCLNLATAVATVLWDRQLKRFLNRDVTLLEEQEWMMDPGRWEKRGLIESASEVLPGVANREDI